MFDHIENEEKIISEIKVAQEKFAELIQSEYQHIERMKNDNEVTDFNKLDKIVVGVLLGDGIGPIIMKEALRVLGNLLEPEIASGRIEFRTIEGMTIENRAAKLQSLPDDVFEEIKKCNVLLKGPMVTPRAGEPWPNLISANSLLRRGLELYAAVRPIRIPNGKRVFNSNHGFTVQRAGEYEMAEKMILGALKVML